MSEFAILVSGKTRVPRVVRLSTEHDGLGLFAGDGSFEGVPWWRLYRLGDEGTTHRFRRLDRRDWELRVTSGADRALLSHVGRRPLHRIIHPFRRLESAKVFLGLAVLLFTLAEHAPAEWLARAIPEAAERRLANGVVAQQAPRRCSRAGGEAALRKILLRLDPDLGTRVEIVALNDGGFMVTGLPGEKLILMRSALTEVDAEALPALLAHELSHIRHGDSMAAAIRNQGLLSTLGGIMEAGAQGTLRQEFTGLEERRADLEAIQMMRRAGLRIRPAADLFEEMRVSKAQGGFYGYDQRDFHFGIDARTPRWAAAAAADPPNPRPLLTRQEEDDLYNFCWVGPLRPLPGGPPKSLPPAPPPPGIGTIKSPTKDGN